MAFEEIFFFKSHGLKKIKRRKERQMMKDEKKKRKNEEEDQLKLVFLSKML